VRKKRLRFVRTDGFFIPLYKRENTAAQGQKEELRAVTGEEEW
jgi:hypothetical protein